MKRILFPTDFSENARHALHFAMELYKEEECGFYLFNVFQPQPYVLDSMMLPEPGEKYYDYAKNRSEERLKKEVKRLKAHQIDPKHTFATVSEIGYLIDGVMGLIAKKDIDLIVMGTKGATGSKWTTFGTHSVHIMKNVRSCPILVVPQKSFFEDIGEIVFPTNYKTPFNREWLMPLIDLAIATGATLQVLYVAQADRLNEKQRNNKKLLDECLKELEHYHHVLHYGSPFEALLNFAESRGSDLITLTNRKHGFFKSFFTDPMIENLGFYSEIPILSLPEG